MKAILKYPILLINRLYVFIYFNLVKKYDEYKEINIEEQSNILVLSPHVDDETIGLGGTIIKYSKTNGDMNLVYLTDGSGSISEKSIGEVIEERRKEGEDVKASYGFKDVYFLDAIDGSLNSNEKDLVYKLGEIIDLTRPDVIFSPFFIDGNKDHTETTKVLSKALELTEIEIKEIYLYEVNNLICPKVVNTISSLNDEIYKAKKDKYSIFKSQWAMGFSIYDLMDYGRGLNYRDKNRVEPFVNIDQNKLKSAINLLENNGFDPGDFKQISSEFTFLPGIIKNHKNKSKYNEMLIKLLYK